MTAVSAETAATIIACAGCCTSMFAQGMQVMTAQDAVSDRFFNALYQSLLHPEMSKSTALPQFLSIVFQVRCCLTGVMSKYMLQYVCSCH